MRTFSTLIYLFTSNFVLNAQNFTKISDGVLVDDGQTSISSSWGDYDNDGDMDVIIFSAGPATLENPFGYNYLLRNDCGGIFTRMDSVTLQFVNQPSGSMPSIWIDINNDGLLDLLTTPRTSSVDPLLNSIRLYVNNGNDVFTEVVSGDLVTDATIPRSSTSVDYDNDGFLDIFIVNENGVPNALYHNDGNGNFTKVTSGDIVAATGAFAGATWGDSNGDGYMDLFVANRAAPSSPNLYYVNNGDGTFTNMAAHPITLSADFTYGVAWIDYDNDLDLDLFVQNGITDDLLFMNNSNGTFTNTNMVVFANLPGISQSGTSWGDYDNDGDLDLFIGNINQSELFLNNGNGTFTQNTNSILLDNATDETVAAQWVDYDNDGDLDLYVNNAFASDGPDNILYENQGNENHWVKVKLDGVTSNKMAVGARVYVTATINGNVVNQMREINNNNDLGGGNNGVSNAEVHFGLGDADTIIELKIVWPASGITQIFNNVNADHFYRIEEGINTLNSITPCRLITSSLNMGVAQEFAILSGNDINIQVALSVTGKAGYVNSLNGTITASSGLEQNTPLIQTALSDLSVFINDVNSLNSNLFLPSVTEFTHGVYEATGPVTLNQTIRVKGNCTSEFIIKVNGDLHIGGNTALDLGSVKPQNLFWVIDGDITIDSGAVVYGNFIARNNFETNGSVNGVVSVMAFNNIIINSPLANESFLTYTALNAFVVQDRGVTSMGCRIFNPFGGSLSDNGVDLDVDGAGNVYLTGSFTGSALFEGNSGNIINSSIGSTDVFIAKYSPTGDIIWIVTGSSDNNAEAIAISIGADTDNIFITGTFNGNISFGGSILNSANGSTYIAKFDISGALIWLVQDSEGVTALSVDDNNDVIVCGTFTNTTSFNGGLVNYNSLGFTDAWVAKYNGLSGAYMWSNIFYGSESETYSDIAYNPINNQILVVGDFYHNNNPPYTATVAGTSPIIFNFSGPGSNIMSWRDGVLVVYDNNTGEPVDYKQIHNQFNVFAEEICVHPVSGNIYISGRFEVSTFTPFVDIPYVGTIPLNLSGWLPGFALHPYLVKLDASLNVIASNTQPNSAGVVSSPGIFPKDLVLDDSENVYLLLQDGYSQANNPIFLGNNVHWGNFANGEVIVLKYDSNLNPLIAGSFSGVANDIGNAIDVDDCYIYIAGQHQGTNDFGNFSHSSVGLYDGYLVSIEKGNSVIITSSGTNQICDGSSIILDAGVGFTDYQWFLNGVLLTGETNQTISANQNGIYSVAVPTSCCGSSFAYYPVYVQPAIDAGPDITSCINTWLTLNPIGVTGGTYNWTPGTNLTSTNILTPDFYASSTGTFTYTITAVDNLGCVSMDDITISVTVPTADAGPDQDICTGASAQLNATGGVSYLWSPNDGSLDNIAIANPLSTPASTTTYTVTVTDANGCTDTDDITVNILNFTPDAQIQLNTTCLVAGTSVDFQNTAPVNPSYIYEWIFGVNEGTGTGYSVAHTYNIPGTYQVYLSVTDPCGNSDFSTIILNVYPDACACNVSNGGSTAYDITDFDFTAPYTQWTGIRTVEGTLTIKAGAELDISSGSVKFGPFGRIVVEPTGTLTLGPGTILTSLDAPCNFMWQGIEVWGDGNAAASDLYQGVVYMETGATVQQAHRAVLLGATNNCAFNPLVNCLNQYNLNKSGGLIFANGAIFDKNGWNIRIIQKPVADISISDIENCIFTGTGLIDPLYTTGTTGEYPNTGNPFNGPANSLGRSAMGIDQTGMKEIVFKGNSFDDVDIAMESIDSKYDVENSIFSNLRYGIRIFNTMPGIDLRHRIQGNAFTDIIDPLGSLNNTAGIQIEGGKYDKILLNDFSSSSQIQADFPNGLYLENSTLFRVEGNTFNNLLNGAYFIQSLYGGGYVGPNSSGSPRNTFNNCEEAVITDIWNKRLRLRCNDHNAAIASPFDAVWRNYGLLGNQGQVPPNPSGIFASQYPAGNQYSPQPRKDVESLAASYLYIHHNDVSAGQPLIPAPTSPAITTVNAGVNFTGNACRSFPEVAPFEIQRRQFVVATDSALGDMYAEYQQLLSALDGGDTQGLLDAVANLSNGQLKKLLIASFPLSDEVLIAYLARIGVPAGHLREVFTMNMPVSRTVRPFLQARINNMPPGIANQLKALQAYNPNYRTPGQLEIEIEALEADRVEMQGVLIAGMLDSNLVADALAELQADTSVLARYQLAETYYTQGDVINGNGERNQISATNAEWTDWLNYTQLYADALVNYQSIDTLDATTLNALALYEQYFPATSAHSYAKAWLRRVLGNDYPLYVPVMLAPQLYETDEQGNTNDEPFAFSIYPNPSTDKVYLAGSFAQEDNVQFEIYDITGELIMIKSLTGITAPLAIAFNDLSSGTYTVRLMVNENEVFSKQLVVMK